VNTSSTILTDDAKLWGKKRKFNANKVTTTTRQHTTTTIHNNNNNTQQMQRKYCILKCLQYESNLNEFGSDIFDES